MGRKPNPENLARQDQTLALLRDRYPLPMTTGGIARETWVIQGGSYWPVCSERGGRHEGRVNIRTRTACWEHCPKVWVPYPGGPRPDAVKARSALIRLERDGLVERVDMSDTGLRQTFWRATEWGNEGVAV